MTRAPRAPEALLEAIAQIVRRELIAIEPAPAYIDDDAERRLVAGVLDGSVGHDDLAPLAPKHFGIPFLSDVFKLTFDTRNPTDIGSALQQLGYSSAAIAEAHSLVDDYPTRATPHYQQLAHRVVELWRRRVLSDAARRANALMACDELDSDGAIERWREAVREIRR